MGVTKQAARKRFQPADGPDLTTDQGFHRFTSRARNTVLAAQNEAHAAGTPQLGPGHLLLGLLAEPDTHAARALTARGATPDAVRAAVTATLPEHEAGSGVLAGPGVDKAATEAHLTAAIAER